MIRHWFLFMLAACAFASSPTCADDLGALDFAAEQSYSQHSLKFAPCDSGLECGSLQVPLHYGQPHGDSIELKVIRLAATNPAKRIGVLFVNPGGPGLSGVDFIIQGLQAPILQRLRANFDIVTFDSRGVARSGAVKCDIGQRVDPAHANPADIPDLLDDFGARVAAACTNQNGPVLETMTTNTIARDIDALRAALHEPQITYLGFSFGTELGAVYASLFPDRVRLMVLDAGVAPERADSLIEFVQEQSASIELALQRVDALCRQQVDCPLASTGVVAAVDTLIERLRTTPLTINGVTLDDDSVRDVVTFSLYFEQLWSPLAQGLAAALQGDFSFLAALAPDASAATRRAINGSVFDSYDVQLCNDFGTRRKAREILQIDEVTAASYPHAAGKFFVAGEVIRCAAWPQLELPFVRDVGYRLRDRILLLGNQFDPATPLSWTRRLARSLGVERNVVRYEGGGHRILLFNLQCMDNLVIEFVTTGRMPQPGFSCAARAIKFTRH